MYTLGINPVVSGGGTSIPFVARVLLRMACSSLTSILKIPTKNRLYEALYIGCIILQYPSKKTLKVRYCIYIYILDMYFFLSGI